MRDLPWRLRYDKRDDGIIISTIKPPALAWFGEYETAVSFDGETWRVCRAYSTKEEALEGHEEIRKMTEQEISLLPMAAAKNLR